jgi:hypothetical protein
LYFQKFFRGLYSRTPLKRGREGISWENKRDSERGGDRRERGGECKEKGRKELKRGGWEGRG